jgi:hypothetical protein
MISNKSYNASSNCKFPKLVKLILVAIAALMLTCMKNVGRVRRFHFVDESLLIAPSLKSAPTDNFIALTANFSLSHPILDTRPAMLPAKQVIKKFFMISISQTTSHILKSQQDKLMASNYYQKALNEESAEIWLHRGFERLPQRTMNPNEADVFLISGFLHLYNGLYGSRRNKGNIAKDTTWHSFPALYREKIVDPTKPHLLLIPSWNPQVSRNVGIRAMVNMLQTTLGMTTNVWSVGFERNPKWQHLPPSRILPLPYVVSLPARDMEQNETALWNEVSPGTVHHRKELQRRPNSIFFAGDARKNAESWSGCYRSRLVSSIQQQQHPPERPTTYQNLTTGLWNIQLLGKRDRLEQRVYNTFMTTSDWCLVLCGDTPSSRTLTSSMIFGCLPLRVGTRLRGLCEDPCHKGFGWTVTGEEYPHLPFVEKIDWEEFLEVDEATLLNSTNAKHDFLWQRLTTYNPEKKERLRKILMDVRRGWIYGWGDPVASTHLGEASKFIWESWVAALQRERDHK